MTEKSNQDDEIDLFYQAIKGTKKLKQDKVAPSIQKPKINKTNLELKEAAKTASFYFSDDFEPYFAADKPMQYVRDNVQSDLAKQIRKGNFYPDLILDLHGLTQIKAKQELAALINAALKQNIECVCVVHGLGMGVLKHKTPAWLVQHPNVKAFHQAPLEWGGNGALLVVLDTQELY